MPIGNTAIVGAGIAGLTAALALARHGIRSEIFEQAEALNEVGAGLQVSPNASRILGELGVLDTLSSVWLEPEDVRLVSGRSLRQIASVPCGSFARERWGAPYGTLHRATLQKALLTAVERNPRCRIHLGKRVKADAATALGKVMGSLPELIIAADGVWSDLRSAVPASGAVRFSGNVAWRFTVPEAQAPGILSRSSVTAFLGPSAHMVCYPLKEASVFNIVAITAGGSASHSWSSAGSEAQRAILRRHFSGWNDTLTSLLDRAEQATFWPLYEVAPGNWHNGRDLVLIGDAAHAMPPFAAQGAAMAIEDAFELAGALASGPVPQALDIFAERRKPRIARLQQRAAFNRFAYHARGPIRLGRDMVLSLRPPQSLAADMDWIYGYRAIG
jgi:salicylate hydroxylase